MGLLLSFCILLYLHILYLAKLQKICLPTAILRPKSYHADSWKAIPYLPDRYLGSFHSPPEVHKKNDDFWNDKHGSKHATNAHATDIKIIATICMKVLYQTKKWWHLYHYVRQTC